MTKGYLALVLHAHLPYVRHVDRADRIEERWLFEAITETYIPLLQVFDALDQDGVDYHITFSISPTLITMLADDLLMQRYAIYLNNRILLAEAEVQRAIEQSEPQLQTLATTYLRRFQGIWDFFEAWDRQLLSAFRSLSDAGHLELITSSATHAFLPYLRTEEAVRAQIQTAISVFTSHFGFAPQGMWLPECAYTPTIDPLLVEHGIRFFFVDTHGLQSNWGEAPLFGTYAPVLTPNRVAAFARDDASSRQVWSGETGYPGDYDYREYYRDIGYDRSLDEILPDVHIDGVRLATGIKYYRITGQNVDDKALYDFNQAREKAALHAGDFLDKKIQQVHDAYDQMGRLPVITAPYDAELFGHWWYEGPIFIDMLMRKIHFDQTELETITPTGYLDKYPDFQSHYLSMSTWGRDGYGDVWLNESNDWIYPVLHDCEEKMIRLATDIRCPTELERRALNQAARELMLAQSSDWAFIMDSKTTVDYAVSRVKHHVNRFKRLASMFDHLHMDETYVQAIEQIDDLFPDLSYEIYRCRSQSTTPESVKVPQALQRNGRAQRILMLAWEYPPLTVGGLSRHVYDLARHLCQQGIEVHVVTMAVQGSPNYEYAQGVHVHRVDALKPDGGEFVHFIFQLNCAMVDYCRWLIDVEHLHFDVLHAHDWLVCDAAKSLKHRYQMPLVSTIHATEHGRNGGIHTELQQRIHGQEWELTYESWRVIVCSSYMKNEVVKVFQLPEDKIDVLPNGIELHSLPDIHNEETVQDELQTVTKERTIAFVGRLVREKGVHLLLDAAPAILESFPNTRFIIMGKGPMQDELMRQAEMLGIRQNVVFTGFVDDATRNEMLKAADMAVFPSLYEPFGIVVLEAMALATPVLVADVGGLGDIVSHRQNGLKMLPGDSQSLSTQVIDLFESPSLKAQVVEGANASLKRFDWSRIAEQTVAVYLRTLENLDRVAELP